MNYVNEKTEFKEQSITLNNRKQLEITGVEKLENLNKEEFLVKTTLGMLEVTGSELEMQHLDLEKHILLISGIITSIEYLDEDLDKNKKEGFFKKLFKWLL